MSSTERQNNLILNQDWTRIYQTFKNADFKSYDFENLRRVIITYLRENYPEDFNDYIESSEYLALIDAIAFLGQSLSFRIDLASRENFIELAERKESVLRIARMLSYNAKRNIPAAGLLKFSSVSTTENIFDSNGRNLAQQSVLWNDPTNVNWAEQFTLILNAAMSDNTEFGKSQGGGVVNGIPTEQYRFRSSNTDVPAFSFDKTVAGRSMVFEIVSTALSNGEEIIEESPRPGNQIGFVYRQDNRGPSSPNTGFFMHFRQGSLELADFNIAVPTTNETVEIEADNINNSDVWLFQLDSNNQQTEEWVQVSTLAGNNIAFNSIQGDIKNIYAVETRENDRVDLKFADGVYGNLPQGPFRAYYRVSNGLSYVISPNEMKGITIGIPYTNSQGVQHTLTVGLGLQQTVSSASPTENIDSIRISAPAQYYTQNRMITGEDYNLAPLASSQNIIKVKAVNRVSSGISRNFDIVDATGKYSDVSVFADDGFVYKEKYETTKTFKFVNTIEITNFIRNELEPVFSESDFYNFYFTNYGKIIFSDANIEWKNVTSQDGTATGYFSSLIDQSFLKTGVFSTNNLKYVFPNALIKFVAPSGFHFMPDGTLMAGEADHPGSTQYKWAKVVSVVGDGTNSGRGILSSGLGPVLLSENIPSGAIVNRILPKFVSNLPTSTETEIINQMVGNQNFGLRYDIDRGQWFIVTETNIDLRSNFSLGNKGDVTNNNLDASWLIAFVKEADRYVIRIRKQRYVFGSVEKNRFYFDSGQRQLNDISGNVITDMVKVLGINRTFNSNSSIINDYPFEITDTIKFNDGYESTSEVQLSFRDSDADGVIDNPDAFEDLVGEDLDFQFIFFQETVDQYGYTTFRFVDNSDDTFLIYRKETDVNPSAFRDGQLLYFYDINEDRVKRVDGTTNTLVLDSSYKAVYGRSGLKFQYIHNANEDRRLDPSVSNIIDVFLLLRSYDTAYRNFLKGLREEPDLPTSDSLRIDYGRDLNRIKSISDEIIYHPVKYKVLFGAKAPESLQVTFKVVKNNNKVINDNDLKVRIINGINEFFDVNNWDFGDRFYLSELNTYIINLLSPDISNFTMVPKQAGRVFGNLFEIQSAPDEIFISAATVDDIEVVTSINATELNLNSTTITSGSATSTQVTSSSSSSSSNNGSSSNSGSSSGGFSY